MLQHPILINRPIVETELGIKLCRPSEEVFELLPVGPVPPFLKETEESWSTPAAAAGRARVLAARRATTNNDAPGNARRCRSSCLHLRALRAQLAKRSEAIDSLKPRKKSNGASLRRGIDMR
jgi:hypothetical protein